MKTVFVDSSFFKGLIDEKDDFHTEAINILKLLENQEATLVTSNYIVDESLTLLRVKCGLESARKLRGLLAVGPPIIKIVRVTSADDNSAWEWFEKDWSGLSFTDCVSFAIMKRLDITLVATFDTHFSRAGFTVLKP